jgi:LysR family transcriptional regulator of gallate degradation
MVCPEATANSLSLRHVLRVVHVAERRSISAAATELNCSTTAVAKSVSEIERLLGVPLFDRGGGVYRATPSGEILARRGRTAWQIYQSTGEAYRRPRQAPHALKPISNKRIDVLLAVYAQRHLRRAAHELQITENAVTTAINTLETLLNAPLFERARNGQVIPSYFADVLARNSKLVRAEIRFAIEEIANSDQMPRGRVVMGMMPRVRELVLPRATSRLLHRYPEINLAAWDAPATALVPALVSGDLDFIVGPLLTEPTETGLIFETLFVDRYVAIARAEHPLAKRRRALTLAEAVEGYGWVLTPGYSIGRQMFRQLLADAGLKEPRKIIETNSFSFVKGLLLEGDWIALSTVAEMWHEERFGELRRLPLPLGVDEHAAHLPISIVRRAHTSMPPAVRLALAEIRAVAAELGRELGATAATVTALKTA